MANNLSSNSSCGEQFAIIGIHGDVSATGQSLTNTKSDKRG